MIKDKIQPDMVQEYVLDSNCKVISKDLNNIKSSETEIAPDLWYRVGEIDGLRIELGTRNLYSKGYKPSISMNKENLLVEVHESSNPVSHSIYYKVGILIGTSIEWGDDIKYGKGLLPKVSININGDVVEVHQSEKSDVLFSRVGKIDSDNKQIIWGIEKAIDHGVTPSVGITNHGMTIVVFKSASCNKLYYRVGQITELSIKWGANHKYQDGLMPQITLCNDRKVILMHEAENLPGIWRLTGYLNEKNIILVSSTDFDSESNLRMEMTTDGHTAIYVYESQLHMLHHSNICIFRNLYELMM